MSMHFDTALDRVTNLEPPEGAGPSLSEDEIGTHGAAFLTAVARMNKETLLQLSSPFFNARRLLASPALDDDGDSARIKGALLKLAKYAYVSGMCENYLVWSLALDKGLPLASAYPDLFEPLIKLFEGGACIRMHHGELEIDTVTFPLRAWQDRWPIVRH